MSRFKSLTANEILDILNESESEAEADIFIEPPDVKEITDEDSGNDENPEKLKPTCLSGNQLRAKATLRRRKKPGKIIQESDSEGEVDYLPISKSRKRNIDMFKWSEEAPPRKYMPIFPESNTSKYKDFTPLELFELFFDEEIIEDMVEQSNLYAREKNIFESIVSSDEMRLFLGVLIITGYAPKPSRRSHWQSSPDLRNDAIYNSMRRNRFEYIMKCLHFKNNAHLDPEDKYSKLRPLIAHLQKKFMLHFIPSQNISHDEAMIEYFGKHSCKQAIRMKPIRFGYKVWCQNTKPGYLLAFDVYQGKTYRGNSSYEDTYGKCAATLLHLIDQYSDHTKSLPFTFYCDNLFTTLPLMDELNHRGYNCIGTIRANRMGRNCILPTTKEMEKKSRGSTSSAYASSGDNSYQITRWKDNAVVTVASSIITHNSSHKVSRWSKATNTKISIDEPLSLHLYSQYKGGVDRCNQNVNHYRISVRGKKWWWSIFTWLLDCAVHNAWQIARLRGDDITHVDFRSQLAMGYIDKFGVPPKSSGRRQPSNFQDARYDGMNHLVMKVEEGKKRRCGGDNCSSIVRTKCQKCDRALCIDCFVGYHTL